MALQITKDNALDFVKQVAAQSYGSGYFEGVNGGEGRIGLFGDKPVKYNTHWTERFGKATPEMIKSSNELRVALGAAAKALANDQIGHLKDIYAALGLKPDGSLGVNKDLLSRKVTANVVNMIDTMRHDYNDETYTTFSDAEVQDGIHSSSGRDTHFNTIMNQIKAERNDRLAHGQLTGEELKLAKTEPWKLGSKVKLEQKALTAPTLESSNSELDRIMKDKTLPDIYFKQLTGDVFRKVITYSFSGKDFNVPKDITKDEQYAYIETNFREQLEARFGKGTPALKFVGNFIHQGCLSDFGRLKINDEGFMKDDMTTRWIPGTANLKGSIDISPKEDGTWRLTMTVKVTPIERIEVYSDDGKTSSDGVFQQQSPNDYYSYSYKLDVATDDKGQVKLSVPEAPVEEFCFTQEPEF